MNELATLEFGLQQLARLENELAGVSDLLVGIHHGTVGSGGRAAAAQAKGTWPSPSVTRSTADSAYSTLELGLAGAKGNIGILIRTASCRARAAEKFRRQRIELRPEVSAKSWPDRSSSGSAVR